MQIIKNFIVRILRLVAITSLLVCIAVICTWKKSNVAKFNISWFEINGSGWEFNTSPPGVTCFSYQRPGKLEGTGLQFYTTKPNRASMEEILAQYSNPLYGFSFASAVTRDDMDDSRLDPGTENVGPFYRIPFWFAFTVSAILPAIWIASDTTRFYRWQRRRRYARQSRCVSCGYSLRENKSGKCPECGVAV